MKTGNFDLPPLPDDERVILAVRELMGENEALMARVRERGIHYRDPGPTANDVARYLGVRGARRLGNGAVKGSWTGTMSPALRIAPRLRSLARRGLLVRSYDSYAYRDTYSLP